MNFIAGQKRAESGSLMRAGLSRIITQAQPWRHRASRLPPAGHQGTPAFSLHILYPMAVVLMVPQPESDPCLAINDLPSCWQWPKDSC